MTEENPSHVLPRADAAGNPLNVPPYGVSVAPPRAPRVWPALAMVVVYWLARFAARGMELTMVVRFGSTIFPILLAILGFVAWWLIGRRMGWVEKLAGLLAIVAVNVAAQFVAHQSLRGMMWVLTVVPYVLTAWALWWMAARERKPLVRTGGLVALLVLVCAAGNSIRVDGLSGEQRASLTWRWTPTAEQRYIASRSAPSGKAQLTLAGLTQAGDEDWPAFRGPRRDGVVRGATISTDWPTHPPKLLWRKPAGPGWSSPVVVVNAVFTQEQLGGQERVVCRDLQTGGEVWAHSESARFEDAMSGAGPRATPTYFDGRLYTLGAEGALNCLDAATGKPIWSRNIATDAGATVPMWGFSSSPLISDGVVIVYAGGTKGLLAYHLDTGAPAWNVTTGSQSYSSPQPARFDGRDQVLFVSDAGMVSVAPENGKLLWLHDLPSGGPPRTVQPHPLSATQVLISSETDIGTALLDVKHVGDAWHAEQGWASRRFKPPFNDFVVQDGYAYGFDGEVFCCAELAKGERVWREGRYGHGQVVLLADQKLLLVISEEGEAILLRATPEKSVELGRFNALTGKTWNHPAVARGRLVVKNGQELACFDVSPHEAAQK